MQRAFRDAVLHTFEVYGGRAGCGAAITAGLAAADAATEAQLRAAGVHACAPLASDSAERYAFYARGALASLALADYPYPCGFLAPLPANPVEHACDELLTPHATPLAALHRAVLTLVNASRDLPCVDLRAGALQRTPPPTLQRYNATTLVPPLEKKAAFARSLAAELVGDTDGGSAPSVPPAAAARGAATPPWHVLPSMRRPPPSQRLRGSNLGVVAWNYQACAVCGARSRGRVCACLPRGVLRLRVC
jgi:hypothetical protein